VKVDEAIPALEVVGLNAFYRKSQVVFDLALTVRTGETVALLGRNGAGKTSTLLAIAGSPAISARSEAVRLADREISRLPTFKRVRAGLSFVPSGSRAFPNLTVHENLITVRAARNGGGWSLERVYEAFPALRVLRNSSAGSLSGGERQMLAVARAMVAGPKVLMLDEPSEGLAPMIVRQIGAMLRELNEQGLAVLLTEQNHRLALETASRAYFVEKGQIVWAGDAEEASRPDVVGRYLAV
jgi:branched-chain amino acid transport system ATP-binding protein